MAHREKNEGRKRVPAFLLILIAKSGQSATTERFLPPALADRPGYRGFDRLDHSANLGHMIRAHDDALDLGLGRTGRAARAPWSRGLHLFRHRFRCTPLGFCDDFDGRCLLDENACGEGTVLAAAAARAPALKLMLFDLPAVAARAGERLASQGLAARTTVTGGDFRRDALPMGADVATLIRVIHDHNDPQALAILQAVHRALPAGGTLLLAEPMADTPGAEPIGDAYFGFYLLAMGRGRPRSAAELTGLLHAAGFGQVRIVPTRMPLQTGLLVARPKSA